MEYSAATESERGSSASLGRCLSLERENEGGWWGYVYSGDLCANVMRISSALGLG